MTGSRAARDFGKAIWTFTGKGNNVDMVFEHPGESTFPVSVLVVKRGGMVVICAGTTGYNLTMDARYLWMHQKRVQGSHFANLMQASNANRLVMAQRIDPCMSDVYAWRDIPKAHMKMWKNEHRPGNMAVLVSAPRTGLEDVRGCDRSGRELTSGRTDLPASRRCRGILSRSPWHRDDAVHFAAEDQHQCREIEKEHRGEEAGQRGIGRGEGAEAHEIDGDRRSTGRSTR